MRRSSGCLTTIFVLIALCVYYGLTAQKKRDLGDRAVALAYARSMAAPQGSGSDKLAKELDRLAAREGPIQKWRMSGGVVDESLSFYQGTVEVKRRDLTCLEIVMMVRDSVHVTRSSYQVVPGK